MRKILLSSFLIFILLVSGCIPTIDNQQDEVMQDDEEAMEETVMIPDSQLKDEYYRTLLPYKQSASRGLIMSNIGTKYDIKEAEEGLLRLARQSFDPKNHYFQEGQYIDSETAISWLGRKSEQNEEGLNPEAPENMSDEEVAEKAPIYLSHIVEQNYLVMTDDNKVKLNGIAIGLALNSVYYPRNGKDTPISSETLKDQGTKIGEEVVQRLRAMDGLEDIPIVVGLFKQESRDSIVPGNYFATVYADRGKKPGGWKEVNEKYVLFPASSIDEKYRDTNTKFRNFKQAIDEYFPSFVNVIGRGFYQKDQLNSLEVEIPIQFFGTSEIIGFVQYLTGLIPQHLPNVHVSVNVTSVNGTEALIVKEAGDEEPFVHIYSY